MVTGQLTLRSELQVLRRVQDLDFADEDYEKLEEENKTLLRVISQLSPS